jgi:hypothetical protein
VGCPWRINISLPKDSQGVVVTHMILEHHPDCSPQPENSKFLDLLSPEQTKIISKYTTMGLSRGKIIQVFLLS